VRGKRRSDEGGRFSAGEQQALADEQRQRLANELSMGKAHKGSPEAQIKAGHPRAGDPRHKLSAREKYRKGI
jgi:hypothetical protein